MKFLYKNTSQISENEISQTADFIKPYLQDLKQIAKDNNYEANEASINLPFDDKLSSKVKDLAQKKYTNNLKFLIIIGIGGSNLGTKALYDGLHGFYDVLEPKRFPKIIFLDTQDEEVLFKMKNLIESLNSKEEFLINAISKSGGTTETAANLELIYSIATNKFGSINDRIVVTTDEGSNMQLAAEKNNIDVLNLPKKVGGRFSVFSAVGMFPFSILGYNTDLIRKGAQYMRDLSLEEDLWSNPALISAIILFYHYKKGKNINDNFIFLPQLESLGKWYRQLMGESLGKQGKGITPTISIGSTDLHSVGQLYLGGSKDKVTTFIYGEDTKFDSIVPTNSAFNLVDVIKGKHIHDIMTAIVTGTKIAYEKQELPFMEIAFKTVNEESIGEFMQFKMMEMIFLGKLMEVNTFDQPEVELYKIETKKILIK